MKTNIKAVELSSPLSLRHSFSFPIQNAAARKEVITGGLWLLVPVVGWLLNMGHRIMFVHQMHKGDPPFPAWNDKKALLKHGLITFLGMFYYYTPAIVVAVTAFVFALSWLWVVSLALVVIATVAIPGYMTFYCKELDPREIFDPRRALRRVAQGGAAYWQAWGIVLVLLASSFFGLLLIGVGFLFTSVWFWQSAGFSFATVFTRQIRDAEPAISAPSAG